MKSKNTSDKEMNLTLNEISAINGNRRLIREKVLQILVAYFVSGTSIDLLIEHIHNRAFVIDESLSTNDKSSNNDMVLLSEEELVNINADTMIKWRESDIKFGIYIIHSAIQNYDNFVGYIKEVSENWDFDRISIVDKVIIIMAITEFVCAIDIPVKVSINEAIELAKNYSTDKSSVFVNGLLDKIKVLCENKNLINKSERGLQ